MFRSDTWRTSIIKGAQVEMRRASKAHATQWPNQGHENWVVRGEVRTSWFPLGISPQGKKILVSSKWHWVKQTLFPVTFLIYICPLSSRTVVLIYLCDLWLHLFFKKMQKALLIDLLCHKYNPEILSCTVSRTILQISACLQIVINPTKVLSGPNCIALLALLLKLWFHFQLCYKLTGRFREAVISLSKMLIKILHCFMQLM